MLRLLRSVFIVLLGLFSAIPQVVLAGDSSVHVSITHEVKTTSEAHVDSSSKINVKGNGGTLDANVSLNGEKIEVHQDESGREVRHNGELVQTDDGTNPLVVTNKETGSQDVAIESETAGSSSPSTAPVIEVQTIHSPESAPWFMLFLHWISGVLG